MFITGCDSSTEWMLPWFIENFKAHNTISLAVYDFGNISPKIRALLDQNNVQYRACSSKLSGWANKPAAMVDANIFSHNNCWLDTDCEVLGDLSRVFDWVTPDRLCMCEDLPWSRRRGETWHNSGVVAYAGIPRILALWAKWMSQSPTAADQDVLHAYLRVEINRLVNVTTLPPEYNWLRLMLVDGLDSPSKKVMHWTGQKGKLRIKEMMQQ